MTKVLIVSRTRMGERHCIGGLDREDGHAIRLCPAQGDHGHPADAPYRVGDVWDLELVAPPSVELPHAEDMVVRAGRFVARQYGMARYIRKVATTWSGGIDAVFDGALRFTVSGRGYLPFPTGSRSSVGFWQPSGDLRLDGDTYSLASDDQPRAIRYVGVDAPSALIPAGSLVRVSLSRVFAPTQGPRGFWLQLSGWYPK